MSRDHLIKESAVRRFADEEDLQVSKDAMDALDAYVRAVLQNAMTNARRCYKRVHGVHIHKAVRKR